MKKKLAGLSVLFFVLFAGLAHALEIEGIQVGDRVVLGNNGPQLVLNGAGGFKLF